jgi:uncharacterized membrane protein
MEIIKQDWYKSPVVWSTLAALVFFIAKEWIGFEIPKFEVFIEIVIGLGVAFGIINSPTNKNSL